MRLQDPLIVGGGPAGSAAAIMLTRGGVRPLIVEKQRAMGDALCGGFLSWHTLRNLERLGVDLAALGGHPIGSVRVFARAHQATASLPAKAVGLSRRKLDTVMLSCARDSGAGLEIAQMRHADERQAETLFLATGKYDLRGLARPRPAVTDPALGLRIRLAAHPRLHALLDGAIELHLFDRGYAGLLLQEDGTANLCLAVRKSRLAEAGGQPAALLAALASECPALVERMAFVETLPAADAIAAVPYGWRAADTTPGVFRLGDQAAVIPSLAGEGIGMAIASGMAAAAAWQAGGADAAPAYQRDFYRQTRRPVTVARLLWERGEQPFSAALATRALAIAPGMTRLLARATRIGY
ncbi:MAG: NAD(P)/FAD-dependent oxidoreductase [Sphingomonadaceae bacterium]